MRSRALLVGLALAASVGTNALAATFKLDDPGSQVVPPTARWQWKKSLAREDLNALEMDVRVMVRIDTRAFAGRAGRVYMVLPADPGAPVSAEWQSQGRLLPGRLVSGERAVVFSGTLPGPFLEDTLQVRLSADARRMPEDARRFAFHFEFDTP
ncbi:MAG TPA: hypothetical protein PLD37_03175 [Usitatibacteraceae bacterium]|nr:hypothetical protein [Usitatibacteraceae bacterium]